MRGTRAGRCSRRVRWPMLRAPLPYSAQRCPTIAAACWFCQRCDPQGPTNIPATFAHASTHHISEPSFAGPLSTTVGPTTAGLGWLNSRPPQLQKPCATMVGHRSARAAGTTASTRGRHCVLPLSTPVSESSALQCSPLHTVAHNRGPDRRWPLFHPNKLN